MGHCKAEELGPQPSKAREKTKLNHLWVYPQLTQELHTHVRLSAGIGVNIAKHPLALFRS